MIRPKWCAVLVAVVGIGVCFVWLALGERYLDALSPVSQKPYPPFPPELVKRAAELYANPSLNELADYGIVTGNPAVDAFRKREHPFMAPEPLQACLRGSRVLFLGHSHLQAIASQGAASFGVNFTTDDAWFGNGKGFFIRKMVDRTPFSWPLDWLVSFNYRAALRNATPEVIDTHRFDVIYVTRSMWDLVYFDTHPKDFADSFTDALLELLALFLKKQGGKLVVWPVYSLKYEQDRRGCFTEERTASIREATFLAIHWASQRSGVPIVTPRDASLTAQNIILWDPYDYTKKLPLHRMPDGQHVDSKITLLFAEVLIRGVLQCDTNGPRTVDFRCPTHEDSIPVED